MDIRAGLTQSPGTNARRFVGLDAWPTDPECRRDRALGEAVLSSQIEGTEMSLVDLLEYEAELEQEEWRADVREVSNYMDALRYGIERVQEFPVSLPVS